MRHGDYARLLEEYNALRAEYEELKRRYYTIIRGRGSGEKKTVVLRIRTTPGLLRKWKAFVVSGGFNTYHEALEYLLDRYFGEAAGKTWVEVEVFGGQKKD
ncbi:MAG: hypothetical protein DRO39_08830 [Thermoprotei archaeon]|nr:MAG: hypothetical protein DRO39_08830 [Thermoprotei archaeon]